MTKLTKRTVLLIFAAKNVIVGAHSLLYPFLLYQGHISGTNIDETEFTRGTSDFVRLNAVASIAYGVILLALIKDNAFRSPSVLAGITLNALLHLVLVSYLIIIGNASRKGIIWIIVDLGVISSAF
mmetsp:Transcript_21154/g.34459  ORF Transcript_21154/g.34459 Transcript_21154/m.34459 type:complete len:126 (-) Transcript_21154:7-384(-)